MGEEMSTRGGHLLALFLEARVAPWRSLRRDDRRGPRAGRPGDPCPSLHPLPALRQPRGRCARLLADPDPRVHPDALGGLQPHDPRAALAPPGGGLRRETTAWPGPAAATPTSWTRSARPGPASRAAPQRTCGGRSWPRDHDLARRPSTRASPRWAWSAGSTARRRAISRADVRGRLLRAGTGRDLGYPGGRLRPPRYRRRRRPERRSAREDRPRHALRLPPAGRRQRARPAPLREPPRARPRRAHHQQHARPPAQPARAT